MKHSVHLGLMIDLRASYLKWDGISAPLALKGCWNQCHTNNFWRDDRKGVIDARGYPKDALINHFGVTLEVSKHEKVGTGKMLSEENYSHLGIENKKSVLPRRSMKSFLLERRGLEGARCFTETKRWSRSTCIENT